MRKSLHVLCVSFYFKGEEFIKESHRDGNKVYLLTSKKLENKPWPRQSIEEIFYTEDDSNSPENIANMMNGIAWLMREKHVDIIVALDDYDVEKAATFREEFRIPGMGLTTSRYFRDKLAMRMRAAAAGIRVPTFTSLFSNDKINEFSDFVPTPWVLKPRSEASAAGIKKIHSKHELWERINELGDKRHHFLVEQFRPGDVYHTDSLIFDKEVQFVWSSKYLSTPFEVAHGAGIFRSVSLDQHSDEAKTLASLNADVMQAFGMRTSASHTEFIKSHDDGQFYFLETSSRVGGANLSVLVEQASGINLWREWARMETAIFNEEPYELPATKYDFAGILLSLARYEWPNQDVFDASEVVWKMAEAHHVGMVVCSTNQERVLHLLDEYADIVYRDFHAGMPAKEKPSH